jgi:small basic protein
MMRLIVESFLLMLLVAVSLELTHGFAVVNYFAPLPSFTKNHGRARAESARPNQRCCTFAPSASTPVAPVFATSGDDSTSESSADAGSDDDTDSNVTDSTEAATSASATDDDDTDSTVADSTEAATLASATEEESSKLTFRERIKKLWWKNDDSSLTTRQRLAKMGLAAVLSYGWVSNVSYAVCISLAWFGFSKKTGLSPLAPDQWKPFIAVYAGFFVFNNVIRPLRLGLSIAISAYFDQVVAWVQRKTSFNKSVSIALVVFLFNIVGTISLMCFGITMASLASGVPIFPPKAMG